MTSRDQEWKTMEFISQDPKSLRDIENFEKSRVNLLSYTGKKIGTGISLREVEFQVIESHL
jgi:hypothetical protein